MSKSINTVGTLPTPLLKQAFVAMLSGDDGMGATMPVYSDDDEPTNELPPDVVIYSSDDSASPLNEYGTFWRGNIGVSLTLPLDTAPETRRDLQARLFALCSLRIDDEAEDGNHPLKNRLNLIAEELNIPLLVADIVELKAMEEIVTEGWFEYGIAIAMIAVNTDENAPV